MVNIGPIDQVKRAVLADIPISFGRFTIADNGFSTITPELQSGLIFVTNVSSAAGSQGGFAFDTDSGGASCVLVTTAANFEATTGALNGTTGNDAKFTVSTHTDGKVYLENRLGASKEVHWLMIL